MAAYLDAFKADNYNRMYAMLSKVSQDAIALEDFARRNRDSLNEMSAGSFDYEVLSSLVNPYSVRSRFSRHLSHRAGREIFSARW